MFILNLERSVNIHNRFIITRRNVKTGTVKKVGEAYNILLNQIYTRLCAEETYFNAIHFGTGSGALDAARTSLFSFLGAKAAVTLSRDYSFPVSTWKRTIVIAAAEHVGEEIKEVGIGFGLDASELITHAVIKDSEGNPIIIEKGDEDEITITADVYIELELGLYNDKLLWHQPAGENILIKYLMGEATTLAGEYEVLNEGVHGAVPVYTSDPVTRTPDIPNRKVLFDVMRIGQAHANNGGVKGARFKGLFSSVLPIAEVYAGKTLTEVIGTGDNTETGFNLGWQGADPNDFTIKLDDVVTVEYTLNPVVESVSSKLVVSDPLPEAGKAVAVSSNNEYIAVALEAGDGIAVYRFNKDTGTVGAPLAIPEGLPGTAHGIAFSDDDSYIAVAHEGNNGFTVYNFDAVTGTIGDKLSVPAALAGHGFDIAFSPDDNYIAVAHEDGDCITIYNFNPTTGVIGSALAIPFGLPGRARGVRFSNGNEFIAVAHEAGDRVTVYVFDPSTATVGNKLAIPEGLPGTAHGIAFSDDDSYIAVAHEAGDFITAYNFDPATETVGSKLTINAGLNNAGYGILFSHDDKYLIAAHEEGDRLTVYCFDSGTGTVGDKLPIPDGLGDTGFGVSLASDSTFIFVAHSTLTAYVSHLTGAKHNVVFNDPPGEGVEVKADTYKIDYVPKDSDHVLDVEFALQFSDGSL